MTKRRIFATSALLAAVLLSIASYVLVFPNWFSARQELPQTAIEEHLGQLSLAKGIDLRFVRLNRDENSYVTDCTITNAQYAVAVTEKSVWPPELPHELFPAGTVTSAPWQQITWSDGTYPKGHETDAVLFIDHADANAYCRWLEQKNTKYHFRLPNRMERIEWSPQKAIPNQRLQDSDSAFPRPAFGPGAIRVDERFWLAPWTHELVGFEPTSFGAEDDDEFKVSYSRRFAASGRYLPTFGGSLGTARVVPTTFRVIAVKKDHPKKD